ncbi:hypothetical protein A3C60_02485 [Candidatus Nomurabacteria bacterium RIFCSPHIGHO2_02_FULL_37_45]|nr:MAG: hypothetical protein A3C60_02485 [Candidatus Nomurabacteria bacterium RIFCSPHIGHO2_02_FULL_37_45]
MKNWKKYFKKQEGRKPREQLVRAVSLRKIRTNALDLGSGNFIESKYLAKKFKSVIAMDSSLDIAKYNKGLNRRIHFLNVPFQEVDFSQYRFDLINAQFSLPFYGKKGFNEFIEILIKSLKKDGIFVGQFFGVNDSWNKKDSELVFHTKNQVLNLFSKLKIVEFIEEEREGKTALGRPKHWHIFHFIARK